MGLSVTKNGPVHVLHLSGGLKSGKAVDDVSAALDELTTAGYSKFVFDMKDVSVIDSTGIGVLIRAYSAAVNRGGAIRLVSLSETIFQTLTAVRLLPLFHLCNSEEEAVTSLLNHVATQA